MRFLGTWCNEHISRVLFASLAFISFYAFCVFKGGSSPKLGEVLRSDGGVCKLRSRRFLGKLRSLRYLVNLVQLSLNSLSSLIFSSSHPLPSTPQTPHSSPKNPQTISKSYSFIAREGCNQKKGVYLWEFRLIIFSKHKQLLQ